MLQLRNRWFAAVVMMLAACSDREKLSHPPHSVEALSACSEPVVQLATDRGRAQQRLSMPMTLPVPASISLRVGTGSVTARLIYSLSADRDRALECRYGGAGPELPFLSCERDVNPAALIEASAVRLELSDRNARAELQLCPDGAVVNLDAVAAESAPTARAADLAATAVASDPLPDAVTLQDIAAYVQAAQDDDTVQVLLGDRHAYIQNSEVGNSKRGPRNPHHRRLIFFSHTHHRAVEVIVSRTTVEAARYIEYWPPEGKEELETAIDLARNDPRLRDIIGVLSAGGMLWQPTTDVPYLDHRVIDVRFYDEELVARYYATVDLTDEVVQAAGMVP